MTYATPVRDIRYALDHMAGFSALARSGAFPDLSGEMVDAILGEAALNHQAARPNQSPVLFRGIDFQAVLSAQIAVRFSTDELPLWGAWPELREMSLLAQYPPRASLDAHVYLRWICFLGGQHGYPAIRMHRDRK